jgi:predicted RNase H-like nuclease
MGSWLGVDWADGCWIVARYGEDPLVTTEPSILNVWHEHVDNNSVHAVVIDIPIGLPDSGSRLCDRKAQERLGNRRSTVFSVPRREVVETDDYKIARERNNGSLGSQSWWLFPRIREVDIFLQRNPVALERIYESHPELCYHELADEQLNSKDTESGIDTRLEIIESIIDDAPEFYDRVETVVRDREDGAEWHNRISKGRRDDVLDAAILALTGSQLELQQRSQMDSYPSLSGETISGDDTKLGITPEIVYPK